MRNVWIIALKELNGYFRSPIAYIVLGAFALAFGYFFYFQYLGPFVEANLSAAQYAQMTGRPFPLNVNEMVIRPLMFLIGIIGLFLVPMITMRLFAEEKKTGTIELLMTPPITDLQLILGKFWGAMMLYASLLLLTVLYLLILFWYGNPDWKPVVTGYLGLLLLGGSYLSLGMFISTLTRNQFVAAVLTFLPLLVLWMLGGTGEYSSSTVAQVATYLSIIGHMSNFAKGVIDLKDPVYYLTVIVLGVFLTARSLESVRWRA